MKRTCFALVLLCSLQSLFSQFLPNPELKSFVDLHCHQMANFDFGGEAFFGKAYSPIQQTLPWCTPIHGPGGTRDAFSTVVMKWQGYGLASLGHRVGGYPLFDGWPRWDNLSHQAVYEDWLFRAFEGGLKLMVMLAVHNQKYCAQVNTIFDCSDNTAIVKLSKLKQHMICKGISIINLEEKVKGGIEL